ncbi:MAG: glycosyltransferase family 2 protein [Treponemataceae bacterium]|nr:MAG: glycosyltransferase family 2 protein [Treponemataceae bacterium]
MKAYLILILYQITGIKYDKKYTEGSMIKFSIIIPVYNTEPFLKKCLESCIEQTHNNIEIICVDDCSTDNSREIIREFQEKDNRIKSIFYRKNESQYMARRTGALGATGDYILFLDSDDTLVPNACALLAKKVEKAAVDMIQFGYTEIPGNKKVFSPFYRTAKERIAAYLAKENRYSPAVWTKAYKRDLVLKAYSKMDEFYGPRAQDVYTSIAITCFANSFSFLKKPLVNYSVGTGVSTRKGQPLASCIIWLSAYRTIIEKTTAFIAENLPEFTDKCKDMEFFFVKDFMFSRLPQLSPDVSLEEKYRMLSSLPTYFSHEALYSFFAESMHRYRYYEHFALTGSFLKRIKRIIKVILFH